MLEITFHGTEEQWEKIGGPASNPADRPVIFDTEGLYNITVSNEISNGGITVPPYAEEGGIVSIRVMPHNDYELETLNVVSGTEELEIAKIKEDEDNIYYTFIMPASDVTITATFVKNKHYFWIDGEQVMDKNLKGSGWSYEPLTNTLTLCGANITGTTDSGELGTANILSQTDLNIVLFLWDVF